MVKTSRKKYPKLNILNLKLSEKKKFTPLKWIRYSGNGTGYLDNYYCDPRAEDFPIRDLRDVKGRNKKEPHYEDLTFNQFARCNQIFLNAALKRGNSYIFFFTRYNGLNKEWKGKYLITGYYKLKSKTWIEHNKPRWAVKGAEGKFVHVQDSFPLEKIIGKKIRNARYGRGHLDEKKVKSLLKFFSNKPDMTKSYVKETQRLYLDL